jgi:hypothetical protein
MLNLGHLLYDLPRKRYAASQDQRLESLEKVPLLFKAHAFLQIDHGVRVQNVDREGAHVNLVRVARALGW